MNTKLSIIATLLLTQTACGLLGGESGSDVCDAYLDCVTAATPAVAGAAVALYGTDSACWGSSDDAERCTIACEEGLGDLSRQYAEVPECGDADVEIDPVSILEEELAWDVAIETVSGDCSPYAGDTSAMTEPTEGDEFLLRFREFQNGFPPIPLECTAEGQQFTCDDLEVLGFANIEGTTNPNLTEVIVSMELHNTETTCAVLELVLTPQ
ncbi:MAG: hypothetical protein ACJAZO_003466 [Myxococcota bacterium]|jgi:hypothetical protein